MAKNNAKLEISTLVDMLYNYGLEYISGKWFFKDECIQDECIEQFCANVKDLPYPEGDWIYEGNPFKTPKMINDTLTMFKYKYRSDGYWKPLPIIAEARAVEDLKPLPFPLTDKQLKIINILLHQQEDHSKNYEKCFIVSGVGGSGKSTFLNIVKQLFENDFAALTMENMRHRFMLGEALNSRLICSDELSSDMVDCTILKMLISGDEICKDIKFEKSKRKVKPQSSLMFCCNTPPAFNLDTAVFRRIVYYKMDTPIEAPDISMNCKEWSHEDLVTIAAHALRMDMTNWYDDFKDDTYKMLLRYNPVYMFRRADTYYEYSELCKSNHVTALSLPSWLESRKQLRNMGVKGFDVIKEETLYSDDGI